MILPETDYWFNTLSNSIVYFDQNPQVYINNLIDFCTLSSFGGKYTVKKDMLKLHNMLYWHIVNII